MELAPTLTTPPAVPVITPEEARQWSRIDTNDEDLLLQASIASATQMLEKHLGQAFVEQTWSQSFCRFDRVIRLAREPLRSVESVTYYDGNDAPQTLATSVYGVHADALGPFVTLKSSQSWPAIFDRRDAVTVTYKAGYGTTAAAVPAPLKAAILLIVDDLFENRGAKLEQPMPDNPTVERLIAPYRRISV